ncbi:MAG TPA: hypothetical protein VH440_04580 [Candidatus Limnocylindrales bacterium]
MTDDTRPTDPFRPAPPAAPGTTPPPVSSPFGPPPASAGSGVTPGAAFAPGPVQPAAPVAVPAQKKRSGASLFVNVLLGVALVVAVGGVAFAAGRATAPQTANAGTGRFGTGNGGNFAFGPGASGAPDRQLGGGFGGAGGGITIEGTVTAVAADSITLQLTSGQTITIPTTSSTTYATSTAASASDVTSGATVKVELSGGGFVRNGNGGNGNGNGGNGNPGASGAPTRGLGSASSITVVPAGG